MSKTDDLLRACRCVLAEYGSAITVRQLYYRLVAGLVIPNSLRSYKRLVAHLTRWRKNGKLSPHAFTDLTRMPQHHGGWSDLGDFLRGLVNGYRRDYWAEQDSPPEVWLEKQALATVFLPVVDRLQVTLQICRGYPSVSTLVAAKDRRVRNILYFGDWDPSGVDINRSIEEELRVTWGWRVSLKRVALLPEQIERHQLPPTPPKDTDSRTAGFLAAHGEDTVELDALPPDVLEKLIEDSVREHITDEGAWEEAQEQECRDRQRLVEIAEEESG